MSTIAALGSGLIGACALTAAHEATRRTVRDAPRIHVLGERALAKSMEAVGVTPPAEDDLYPAALAGDLVSNSLYYGLVGLGGRDRAPACGAVLGLIAGVGAVTLPGPMGLGTAPSARTPQTAAMTVGLYLLGGVAAGVAYQLLASRRAEGAPYEVA